MSGWISRAKSSVVDVVGRRIPAYPFATQIGSQLVNVLYILDERVSGYTRKITVN